MTDTKHVEIDNIPFVDESPSIEGQTRIDWIRNGETPDGATSIENNSGSLNRAGVKIQQNVVTINKNTQKLKDFLNEVKVIVDTHSNILGEGTQGIFERVTELEEQIKIIDDLKLEDSKLSDRIDVIVESIGVVTSGVVRTVRNELAFLKNTIGNYPNFDSDGLPKPNTVGTGMKGQLRVNIDTINAHNQRLLKIEHELNTSDVSQLKQQLSQLRLEIGPSTSAEENNVYARLQTGEESIAESTSQIDQLNGFVNRDSYPIVSKVSGETVANIDVLIKLLDTTVKNISDNINNINNETQEILGRLGATDGSEVGSFEQRTNSLEQHVDTLNVIVGETDSDGLRKKVSDVQSQSNTTLERVEALNTNIQTEVVGKLNTQNQELFVGPSGVSSNANGIVALMRGTNSNAPIGSSFSQVGTSRAAKHVYDRFVEGDGFASELNPNMHNEGSVYVRNYVVFDGVPSYRWLNLDSRNVPISEERFVISPTGQSVLRYNDNSDIVFGNSSDELIINSKIKSDLNLLGQLKLKDQVVFKSDANLEIGNSELPIVLHSQSTPKLKIGASNYDIIHTGNIDQHALTTLGNNDITMQVDKRVLFGEQSALGVVDDVLEIGKEFPEIHLGKIKSAHVIGPQIVVHDEKSVVEYKDNRYNFGHVDKNTVINTQNRLFATINNATTDVWTNATHDAPTDGRSYVRKNGGWTNVTLSDVDGSITVGKQEIGENYFIGFAKDDVISGISAFGDVTDTNAQGADLVAAYWSNASGLPKFQIVLKGAISSDFNFKQFKRDYVNGSGVTVTSVYDVRDATRVTNGDGDTVRYTWDTQDLVEIPVVDELEVVIDFILTDAFDFTGGIDHAPNDGQDYVSRGGDWKPLGEKDINLSNAIIRSSNEHLIGLIGDDYVIGNNTKSIVFDSTIKIATIDKLTDARGEVVWNDNGSKIELDNIVFKTAPTVAGDALWGDFNAPDIDNNHYWARRGGEWVQIFNGVDVDSDLLINETSRYGYNVDGEFKRFGQYINGTHVLFDGDSKTQFKGKVSELNLDVNTKITGVIDNQQQVVIGVNNESIVIGDNVHNKPINISSSQVKINDDKVLTNNEYEAPLDGGKYTRRNGEWVPAYYFGDVDAMPTNPVDGDVFFEFLN